MASRPLIKECLFILNLCGANPKKRNALTKILLVLSEASFVGVCFEILLACISDWKGLHSMKFVVVIIELYQLALKLMIMIVNRKIILSLLDKMEHFWPTNKYGEKLEKEIKSTYDFLNRCFKVMFANIMAVGYMYMCQPLLSSKKAPLPFKTAHLKAIEPPFTYYMNYFLQASVTYPGIIVLFGFDGFFLALIVNITCELKILKQGLRSIAIDGNVAEESSVTLKEMRALIDHHNLISRCIKDVDKIYQVTLLNAFFFDMLTICVSLLGIIVAGFPPSVEILSNSILNASVYILQLFMYSMMGTYLISESESISTAIYECDWWLKTQPNFRKSCVMMIQRANKSEELVVGGVFKLNLDTFTRILRTTLTFFTFMQAVYKVED